MPAPNFNNTKRDKGNRNRIVNQDTISIEEVRHGLLIHRLLRRIHFLANFFARETMNVWFDLLRDHRPPNCFCFSVKIRVSSAERWLTCSCCYDKCRTSADQEETEIRWHDWTEQRSHQSLVSPRNLPKWGLGVLFLFNKRLNIQLLWGELD